MLRINLKKITEDLIPSFYLAYNLLNEKKYAQKVEQFISNEFTNNGYTIIYKNTKFNWNDSG